MELLTNIFSPTTSYLILTGITLFLWHYIANKLNYWNKQGVPYIPAHKCIAQSASIITQKVHMFDVFREQYKLLEGHKYGGTFQLLNPSVILRDPEAIKEWLVKSFSHFHDRGPKPTDRLSENLFALTGEKWRTVRHNMSPAFSSAKLKIMYATLKGCAVECGGHLEELCAATGETELELKEFASNYTMDVIGACAMGIKCNAIKDPENCEMKRVVRGLFVVNLRTSLFQVLQLLHPKLPSIFRVSMFRTDLTDFIFGVTKSAMEMKAKDGPSDRKDFLQILMNLSRSEVEAEMKSTGSLVEGDDRSGDDAGPVFTESTITGVIMAFLSAGVDPVSTATTFCLYELAHDPHIQERIFKEIQTLKRGENGGIRYEDLKELHYLDQVVSETLRKYPIAGVLFRICTEPFQIPGTSAVIKQGTQVFVPICGLHHDPKFFPEPEKFDPERFSEENIHKIVPGSYIPFGDGPRFCIAMRLALMDVKTMVITLVSDYTLHTSAKTEGQLQFDKKVFTLSPEGQIWIRLKKRSSSLGVA